MILSGGFGMTNIGKENIIKRIQNSRLLNDFEGAEEYIISLINKDIEYSSERYITLREAIEKYGEDNLMYYIDNLDSIGTVIDNWIGCNSIATRAAFHYTFNTVVVTR